MSLLFRKPHNDALFTALPLEFLFGNLRMFSYWPQFEEYVRNYLSDILFGALLGKEACHGVVFDEVRFDAYLNLFVLTFVSDKKTYQFCFGLSSLRDAPVMKKSRYFFLFYLAPQGTSDASGEVLDACARFVLDHIYFLEEELFVEVDKEGRVQDMVAASRVLHPGRELQKGDSFLIDDPYEFFTTTQCLLLAVVWPSCYFRFERFGIVVSLCADVSLPDISVTLAHGTVKEAVSFWDQHKEAIAPLGEFGGQFLFFQSFAVQVETYVLEQLR